MTMTDGIYHDQYADVYDDQVKSSGCYIHDLIFGLCYEYITSGQKLLDAGIGSGLSSQLFAKAGLKVYGMDFSQGMLDHCRAKNFAEDLVYHDISALPWPYLTSSIDHVVSCGVFHFIPRLEDIFLEIRRIIRPGGVFGFTTKNSRDKGLLNRPYTQEKNGNFMIYSHGQRYIERVVTSSHFDRIKLQRCFIAGEDFSIWIVR